VRLDVTATRAQSVGNPWSVGVRVPCAFILTCA
jgi:hypothetical protein